jgi:hypothetical protein
VRGLVLIHYFAVGFCVEQQAIDQFSAAADDATPPAAAELIGPDAAPLAAEAGTIIFGDPDERFTGLLGPLLDTIDRLRASS